VRQPSLRLAAPWTSATRRKPVETTLGARIILVHGDALRSTAPPEIPGAGTLEAGPPTPP